MNRQRRTAPKSGQDVSNRVDAESPSALCDTGRHYLLSGLTTGAINCCQRALAINPHHGDALRLMGEICLHAGQPDQLIEWLANAVRIEPTAEHVSALGMAVHRSGKLEDALKAFDKAISLQPGNAVLWKNLASVLIEPEVLSGTGIVDLTENLSDFDQTSALISCLDLVISVDELCRRHGVDIGGAQLLLRSAPALFTRLTVTGSPSISRGSRYQLSHYRDDGLRPDIREVFCIL
jgi:tetratricopeptide (TPR) repeat protein